MALELLPLVLHHAHVPPAHKVVLFGIANHQRDNRAWPSVATLAGYAGVSERQVQRILRDLEQLNLITVQRSRGMKGLNVYALNILCPPDCDRTPNHRRGVTSTSPGVTPMSPRGDKSRTLGVTPMSPEPVSINQYRTHDLELKRMRELAHAQRLRDEAEYLKQHAEPSPLCEHGLRLVRCNTCCKALEERETS